MNPNAIYGSRVAMGCLMSMAVFGCFGGDGNGGERADGGSLVPADGESNGGTGTQPAECPPVERLASGEACRDGSLVLGECEPGSSCQDGTCQILPGQGEPCAEGMKCAADLYCKTVVSTSTCEPPEGIGGNCDSAAECLSHFCKLVRNQFGAITGTCREAPAEGEPCENGQCAEPLVCEPDPETEDDICVTGLSVGEACGERKCARGLFCIDDACSQGLGLGEECDSLRGCAPPLVCDWDVCECPE